ncbi:hypothetical protein GCM10025877_30810 [Agromyces mangrovi Wang et al. 2018]|nr:hypothetical protein GCM10025877_30810 [Agromyces mangrovi]
MMQQQTMVVAIDGPAGSGKSSVSKAVARRLGFGILDTGAAYRALAWSVLDGGLDPEDAGAVIAHLPAFALDLGTDNTGAIVHVGEVDVTAAIREPRISAVVSAIARVPEVRRELIARFRVIAADAPKRASSSRGATSRPWWRPTRPCASCSPPTRRCASRAAPPSSSARRPTAPASSCAAATAPTPRSSTS